MSTYRTHTCGELTKKDLGKKVRISGFLQSVRDHGGVLFIDIKDYYGVTQAVIHDDSMIKGISKQTVIMVTGTVIKRDEDTISLKIPTGEIEILVDTLEVISDVAKTLPFELDTSEELSESVRLKYRFLDLRRDKIREKIIVRTKIIDFLRKEMKDMGFLEVSTPIITSSSPEGARDYIIPSRKHKGKFYALPQAPQQFKQLLMASGFDKYFQVAPCFRDEDGRSDRLVGEFYQLDMEMAYADSSDVMKVAEYLYPKLFKEFGTKKVPKGSFKKIPYKEAMLKYGTDKPDLRIPLEIIDVSDIFKETSFRPFRGTVVRAIKVDGIGTKPSRWFDSIVEYAKTIGMPGIGYVTLMEDGSLKGPIDKFLTDVERKTLIETAKLKTCDVLFFIAHPMEKVACYQSGLIRVELGRKLDLIDKDEYKFCFITEIPMYEKKEETGKLDFMHNPFSMPIGEMKALEEKDALDIYADQFDVVCDGVELVSGATRDHKPEVLVKAFEKIGYDKEEVKEKFGALYTAFSYGCPPHAGMALGIDRAIMMLLDEQSIRETVAFPLSQSGEDILTGTPCEVSEKQLREVHIKLR